MTRNAATGPRVLLIGQETSWGLSLIEMLEASRCAVSFARRYEEAIAWIQPEEFDLILASPECRHELHLLSALRGSHTSVFYVLPVENSCWWVPALQSGVDCYGSSALRPPEFAVHLKETLHRYGRERMKAAS